ncbi:MAG: hypothetical protein JSV80_05310, partial [Acidobacteriota bacterium]
MADRSHIQIEVEIGDVVVRLQANDESFIGKVRARSGPFLVDRAPDFSIELELGDDPTSIEHQQVAFSLHLTAAVSYADGFPAAGEQSWVGWSNETLRLRLQRELFDFESPNRPRLLNVLFCAAYNTVCERQRSRSRHGYLMHGCGVLVGERAMLFTGRSGAGKSTTAALAGDRPVLNDDIDLLDFSGKSPR